jgi:NAD(P)-dependent dehydrogenase (short-subunit alcohol dehydrogenase family)
VSETDISPSLLAGRTALVIGGGGGGIGTAISRRLAQAGAAVAVADVDAAYADAQRRGYDIVHPLTHEPWGVRRFFVRDPHGVVFNIVGHAD